MKILINYADSKYEQSRRWNSFTGKHIAKFDKVYEFHPNDIDSNFVQHHLDILQEKRGNGLWIWKPYFINKILSQCKNGDIIFYCDAGAFFIRKIKAIETYLNKEHPLFVCDIPLLESCFTKPSAFQIMDCNDSIYKTSNQIIATYIGIYVCEKSKLFIEEWLNYCCNYELMKSEGTLQLKENKKDSFVAHREDQSVLSLLCKKKGVQPHKDITQRGNNPYSYYNPNYSFRIPSHPHDTYKSIIYLHKSPSVNLYTLLRPTLKAIYNKLWKK